MEDWHKADIIAALHKKGTTLANALSRGWPRGEWLIAHALNIHPCEIWPSRWFDREGRRLIRLTRAEETERRKKHSDAV